MEIEKLEQQNYDLDEIISSLYQKKKISQNCLKMLCQHAEEYYQDQLNIVKLSSPVTVCGDIRGQYNDLLDLFKIGGYVPNTNYLFLGDYVNNGKYSVECVSLLIALKLRYQNRITLLRGEHEQDHLSREFGFYEECNIKYSVQIYHCFLKVFELLPMTAIIEDEIFCLNGGLSPGLNSINQLNFPTSENQQLLKSDTQEGQIIQNLVKTSPGDNQGWVGNGYNQTFGQDVTNQFLHKNNLKQIIRSHQLLMEGHQFHHSHRIHHIFSAPDYCGRCGNLGAIIEFDESMNYFIQRYSKQKYLEVQIEDTMNKIQSYNNLFQFGNIFKF